MRTRIAVGVSVLVLVVTGLACKKGSPVGSETTSACTSVLAAAAPVTNATLSVDVQPIFTTYCAKSNCHTGTGLDLRAGHSYGELVGVTATGGSCSGKRVVAGNSSTSVLIKRISGTCGIKMPANGKCLDSGRIATIKNWIDLGALNN